MTFPVKISRDGPVVRLSPATPVHGHHRVVRYGPSTDGGESPGPVPHALFALRPAGNHGTAAVVWQGLGPIVRCSRASSTSGGTAAGRRTPTAWSTPTSATKN